MKKTTHLLKISALAITFLAASTSAFAEKPYVSEMPNTIGLGAHQFEYSIDYSRPRHIPKGLEESSITEHDLTYAYGVSDNFDLSINLPFDNYYRRTEPYGNLYLEIDDTKVQDLEIAAKAAYYKSAALEMGAKLAVSLPTGDEKYFNNARSAGKANVGLIAAHRLNLTDKFSLHHNLSFVTRNKKGAPNDSEVGNTLGATYKFNPNISAVVDAGYVFSTRDSDANARFAAIGGQYTYKKTKIGTGFKVTRSGNDIEHSYNLGFQQVF